MNYGLAANIEKEILKNPFNIDDICSHVTMDTSGTLVISNWMPNAANYTV